MNKPHLNILPLSFAHLAVGILFFIAAMSTAVYFIPALATTGTFRTGEGWLLAHMMLLGFASFIAIGASYQLIQVIMRTSLFSKTMGWIGFGSLLGGLVMILLGFAWEFHLIAIGGILSLTGMITYATNIMMTIIRKGEWNPFVLGTSFSVVAFICTGIAGTLMGLTISGRLQLPYQSLFISHLWLGIGGWLSGLIVIYSFKLLPMFYVSSKKIPRDIYLIVTGFHLAVCMQVLSLWTDLRIAEVISNSLLLISLARFVIYTYQVRRASHAKVPVGAVRHAFVLITAAWSAWTLWVVGEWLGFADRIWLEGLIVFLIAGWFAGSILAYLSKILPFLWWGHRFSNKERRKEAVLLSDMLPERRLTWELAGYAAGTAVMTLGFVLQQPGLAWVGQLAAFTLSLIYTAELLRVFRW